MARPPRMAAHHDTTFRPIMTGAGNDDWQRQADAAAWSAISGMAPGLYLGGIEPIPVPPDLKAQMRQAAAELTAMPSRDRAEVLLRLAHTAAYGPDAAPPVLHGAAGPAVESPRKPAGGVLEDWWGDIAAASETPPSAPVWRQGVVTQRAIEGGAAVANVEDDPANEGEVSFEAPFGAPGQGGEWGEWWEWWEWWE